MKRAALVAFTALIGLAVVPAHALATPAATGTPGVGSAIRPNALAPSIPRGATRLGLVPAAQSLTIEVVLAPSNPTGLQNLLDAQYDPSSPQYQHWLTPAEFAQAFGPSAAEISVTTDWLHASGLDHTSVDGFAVRATGPASTVASALGVSFSRLALPDGTAGYAASAAPLIPSSIAADVTSIVGLSDAVRFDNRIDLPHGRSPKTPRPMPNATAHSIPPASACTNARNYAGSDFWTPDQVASIYGVNDLLAHNEGGQSKTIGILELAPSRPSDTSHYLTCLHLHNTVAIRKIDGGSSPDQLGTLEAEIDIQEAATDAPGASIRSYEAPNDAQGEYDAYQRMVLDNVPVISTSWGRCEPALAAAPGFIGALHALFQRAAAQGQSVFAASGDKGSEDCYDPSDSVPDTSLQVDNPADDPFVTGVGGTSLGAPGLEPVWNDCENAVGTSCASSGGDATGGGESTKFTRPNWQPLAADATCSTCRGVPDIAANAGVPEAFFDSDFPPNGDPGPDNWVAVGGTSIAAPKLAGIAADIASGCTGGRIGDFAPKLDALAATHVYGTAISDIATGLDLTGSNPQIVAPGDNDLTRNNTRRFKAQHAFDLSTGAGAPIGRGLSCPEITSLTPMRGKAGTHVVVHGIGLERATIKFGSTKARVLSANAITATVVVPAGKGAASVSGVDAIGTGSHHALFDYPGADTSSYRTVAADGGIFDFGGAHFYGSPVGSTTAPIIGMAVDHSTGGYWLASSDGNVYAFNAPSLGSVVNMHLNQPIVGIAATASGDGYWLVARDGGIFAFGTARYHGSTGGMHLNQPIVGIATDAKTGGYWLVASDGGIFAFDAPYFGSTGGMHLNQPVVGMVEDAATGGYWLVATDGGIFAFHAPFYGSTGGIHLNQPIVGIAATGDAHGYWFVARDGGVFSFGDAHFAGSEGGTVLSQPMVAMATAH